MVAKVQWEADKCSTQYSHRLLGNAGRMRFVPITSMKLLLAKFYRLKIGHAVTGTYLQRIGHRDDCKWWL
jgi:hypothetical protein